MPAVILAGGFIFLIDVNGHITASENATVSAFTNDYQDTSDRMASSSQEIADQNMGGAKAQSNTAGSIKGKGKYYKGKDINVEAEPTSSKGMIHIQVHSSGGKKWPLKIEVAKIDYQGTSTDSEIKDAIKTAMKTDKKGANTYNSLNKTDIDTLVRYVKKSASHVRKGTSYEMK